METEKDHKVAFFVDDDRDFIEMIPQIVRHPHFEIRSCCATNGYQVIDEVIRIKPDVLFIDFGLPRANGGQILPILRSVEALSDLRVYFVTGYSTQEVLPFVQGLEFHGILSKGASLRSEIIKILNENVKKQTRKSPL